TGPYVIFTGQAKGRTHESQQGFYSIQSFTDTLHRAERRAGVETIQWRAGHAFRRGLVGDLADESGDIMLALQAIGDRDVKMAQRYRVRRNDKIDAAVQGRVTKLFGEGATKVQPNDETAPESAVESHPISL
ncbi:MAG TPA: hypothetical protein VGQ30_14975, partial [Gemmatimonadaceae bacterium]|nr:hypothetical protein [Gemmatimonadaceae bacterium]